MGSAILDAIDHEDDEFRREFIETMFTKSFLEAFSQLYEKQQLKLNPKQLGFTLCQKPVVYTLSDHEKITVSLNNGQKNEVVGNSIDKQLSSLIFSRSDEVVLIEVTIKK